MNTKRIIWMLDGTLIKTPPQHWELLTDTAQEIIRTIGHPQFEHIMPDPRTLLINLGQQLAGRRFSSVIDLSGWMGKALLPALPTDTPVVTSLHLSRIREASSSRLPTSGHIVSLSHQQIAHLVRRHDLSAPLILDDVSFSGGSDEITTRLLNLDPEQTTHGFLMVNGGDLGGQAGAKHRLEADGGQVLSGFELNTTEGDDGWHFEDVWNHSLVDKAFSFALLAHELRQTPDSEASIWATRLFLDSLFTRRITPEEARLLDQEGRLITNNPQRFDNGHIHTTNPLLWVSPAFLQHTDPTVLIEHHQEISHLLLRVQQLTDTSPSNTEALTELRRQVEGSLFTQHPERR